MGEEIGVGLIGCGNMGAGLARAVQETGVGRMVGFHDPVAENQDKLAGALGGRTCSIDQMMADDEVGAVMIAAPQFFRQEPTEAAARAGKHVYTEKPMALSTAVCDRMIEACRQGGVSLMVGQVLRYIEPFHSIIRWTREGRFGRPFHACVQRVGQGFGFKQPWRQDLARSGGFLFEVSVHELDFMRCLLGEPRTVYAVRQKVRPAEHCMEDVTSLLARFDSGASGHYDCGTAWGKGKYEMVLCFEEATLVSTTAFSSDALEAVAADGETEIALDGYETDPPQVRQLRDWLEAVRDGRPVPTPGEEGRATVRFAEAAYESAESGRLVEV